MTNDSDHPPSMNTQPPAAENAGTGLFCWVTRLFTKEKPDNSLRAALEEYVETQEENQSDTTSTQERAILSNILSLRDMRVVDVMIPRADIVAIDMNTSQNELLSVMTEKQCSRMPVFSDTLDNVLGTIHVKDVLATIANNKEIKILDLIKDIPIVSPSTPVLDLILEMRHKRRHMALVVDEYGGIDGLVTVGDVIEEIIGDIYDEHDVEHEPQLNPQDDGSVLADARVDIKSFEEHYGSILTDLEREESDTLGGLVCIIAGRVPARGEVLAHETGTLFEVLDADPRRVNLLKIRNLPDTQNDNA